jgi:hypothetical protein
MKPPCSGFRSETATWIQKYFRISAGASREVSRYTVIVFQGGDDGQAHRNIYEIPQGHSLKQRHWH